MVQQPKLGDVETIIAGLASLLIFLVTFIQNQTYLVPLDHFLLSPRVTRDLQVWRLVSFGLYSVDDNWLFYVCLCLFLWCLRRMLQNAALARTNYLSHRSPLLQLAVFLLCSIPVAGSLQLRNYGSASIFAVLFMFARETNAEESVEEALMTADELDRKRRGQQSRRAGLLVAVATVAVLYVNCSIDPTDTLWSLMTGGLVIWFAQWMLAALFSPNIDVQKRALLRDYYGGDDGEFAGREEFFNPATAKKTKTVGYCERISPEEYEAEGRLLALQEMSKLVREMAARERELSSTVSQLQQERAMQRHHSLVDDDDYSDLFVGEQEQQAGSASAQPEQTPVEQETANRTADSRPSMWKIGISVVLSILVISIAPVFGILFPIAFIYRYFASRNQRKEQ